MGEISINPKFNIHKTYKKVRILNPYRNSGAPSGSNDADAANYLAAVGIINDATVYYAGTPQEITGSAIYTAMNNFVGTLKSAGVYAKLKAVYPLIGGNAGNHKWNLINPQDTDAAHRVVWFGSGIHSKTGFKGDASTAYGDTNFNQSFHSELNNESFGFYSRSNTNRPEFDMGLEDTYQSFIAVNYSGKTYSRSQNTSYALILDETDSLGFCSVNRISNSGYSIQRKGLISYASAESLGISDNNFKLGMKGDTIGSYNSAKEFAYSFIGEGLTENQMTAHYNAVQQLQTDLKRAI